MGNPAEETCCYPNEYNVANRQQFVNILMLKCVIKMPESVFRALILPPFSLKSWFSDDFGHHSVISALKPV